MVIYLMLKYLLLDTWLRHHFLAGLNGNIFDGVINKENHYCDTAKNGTKYKI